MVETGALSAHAESDLRAAAAAWPALEVLMLFGSAAGARLGAHSDVDLYVRLSRDRSSDGDAEERFVAAASRACRREVDLVVESPRTSVILRREVARKGRVLFERTPGAARQLVVDAIHAYVDLEPYLRRIGQAVRARAIEAGEAARAQLMEADAPDGG